LCQHVHSGVQEGTMGGSETLKRTKSCLAGEAIADFVAREPHHRRD
jgi:hypothetical protein